MIVVEVTSSQAEVAEIRNGILFPNVFIKALASINKDLMLGSFLGDSISKGSTRNNTLRNL